MELTSYFTDRQKAVLKTLWIPGIIMSVLTTIVQLAPEIPLFSLPHGAVTILYFVFFSKTALAFSWEHIVERNYIRAVIVFISYILIALLYNYITAIPSRSAMQLYEPQLIIVWGYAQYALLFLIGGKKRWWKSGLIGIAIYYCMYQPITASTDFHISIFYPERIALSFLLIYILYTFSYLADNFVNIENYRESILFSKIKVVSKKEYQLLFPLLAISCWMIFFQSNTLLWAYNNSGHNVFFYYTNAALCAWPQILLRGLVCYLVLRVTRDVVISRMMTIGNRGGWLYMIHYIPVLNIIAWIITANSEEKHTTKEENAALYMNGKRPAAADFIVLIGVIGCLYGFYKTADESRAFYASRILIMLCIIAYIGKAITYFLLAKKRTVVYTLLGLNLFTWMCGIATFIWAQDSDRFLYPFILSFVTYFAVVEIFTPVLSDEDAAYIQTEPEPEIAVQ